MQGMKTTEDIAFLLGYGDSSSFQRAFALWTGKTVGEFKKKEQIVG